jgi:hypothetical protein
MTVDRTDPYELRNWLRSRYEHIGFRDEFLAATKGMRAANEAQLEEFTAQGLGDVVGHVAEITKGRGRSRKRMERVVVAWCLSEGWQPDDPRIAEAVADVLLWLIQAGRDASLEVVRRMGRDVSRARRELADGSTTFTCGPDLRRHALEVKTGFFDIEDEYGIGWRIWCLEYQGLALLKIPAGHERLARSANCSYACRLLHREDEGLLQRSDGDGS